MWEQSVSILNPYEALKSNTEKETNEKSDKRQ